MADNDKNQSNYSKKKEHTNQEVNEGNECKFRGTTPDELQTMWDASPIRYADRIIAPTLIALGMADQRVPPSQGMEFYHTF